MAGGETEFELKQNHLFLGRRNGGASPHPTLWGGHSVDAQPLFHGRSVKIKSVPGTCYWSRVSGYPGYPGEALFATGSVF